MKARRHHPHHRPSDTPSTPPMNDENSPYQPDTMADEQPLPVAMDALEVDVGRAMPPSQPAQLPVLAPTSHVTPLPTLSEATPAGRSMVAEGMSFVGNAMLTGPCSVAGQVDGNLTQAPGANVAVIVTESGRVKGDITAHKISVMGRTEGILDSGQGEVALHDTASVHGLVRYGRIQVNGADLNATLERVPGARQVA